MSGWEKALLVALPVALVLSVALRFIQHTDREYSYWIELYGESIAWLEGRCAELSTPGACDTAQSRRTFLSSLQSYRDRVNAWWWPALVLAVTSWTVVVAALFGIVWGRFRRGRPR